MLAVAMVNIFRQDGITVQGRVSFDCKIATTTDYLDGGKLRE